MKIAVVGAGAAGLMAAIAASESGAEVIIIEKNEKIGKKLFITGKGRCNVTNNCDTERFFENVVTNKKFLLSAINSFSPQDTMDFFEKNGLKLKTERGDRVFPASDKSSDVIKTFASVLEKNKVSILLNTKVKKISEQGGLFNLNTSEGDISADKIIVTTGGKSYPSTGSTGDGYAFAKSFGHKIILPKPALSAIILKDNVSGLAGLSLKNVSLSIMRGENTLASEFGELLFTHDGISGPISLTVSSLINKMETTDLTAVVDLKPALDEKTLDARILRDFSDEKNKILKNVMRGLVPSGLIETILKNSGLSPQQAVNTVTKAQRSALIYCLKNLSFRIKCLAPLENAIVTSGGVAVNEINPSTMESKLCCGLYFAGEVIDVDALTGGFNLQIAFSTGYIAGKAAAKCEKQL